MAVRRSGPSESVSSPNLLGKLLSEAHEEAGLTQEQFALTAGVDRSYVSQFERDLKSPTVNMLFRLLSGNQSHTQQPDFEA